MNISVKSEIGTLRRLLIHSPDAGLGKVVPSKAQDWLFEDIVHLDTMRKDEYDFYLKILLYFLDPEKVRGKIAQLDADPTRAFFKPDNLGYVASDKVIELQRLLAELLENEVLKTKLIAAVTAVEHQWFATQEKLSVQSAVELAKTLISGTLPNGEMLFAPVPNMIFTRDIGIVINEHLLLNRPARQARTREALLAQYLFFHHEVFADLRGKIIELPDNARAFLMPDDEQHLNRTTLEGGDVMTVAPNHLLIGISERTTVAAAQAAVELLFEQNVVEKVSIVKIPAKRDYMHIDTVFTQVRRGTWVVLKSLLKNTAQPSIEAALGGASQQEEVQVVQLRKGEATPRKLESLEALLTEVSIEDLGAKSVEFIYSGNNTFPYGTREQWTDSCNLLAIKEGVVIGYDRNDKTLEAFREAGFRTVRAADLLAEFEAGISSPETTENTFIMLPSAELSRARGGSHCMSLPLLRDTL